MSIPRIPGPSHPGVDVSPAVGVRRPARSGLAAAWNGFAFLSGLAALYFFACSASLMWNSSVDFLDKIYEGGIYVGCFVATAVFAIMARTASVWAQSKANA